MLFYFRKDDQKTSIKIIYIFSLVVTVIESVVNPKKNPFSVPQDNDVFMLRDKERQKKKQV